MKLLQIYDSLVVELEEVRELFTRELHSDIPVVADMLEHVGKFRGKMLRPMLVLLSGRACGRVDPTHYVLATVAEMIHMATLVHDDVLDEAELRRRGSTLNALHGNEAAVMLGDLLMSRAYRLCTSLDNLAAARLLAATTNTLCEGELMQLYYRGFYDLSEATYLDIIARKTGQLLASCCYLGARAAGADEATGQAMEAFGLKLGIAFQIADDVLDLTGQTQHAGKTLRTDLAQGKTTLPLIHYLHTAGKSEIASVKALLPLVDPSSGAELIDRLRQAGSITYARQKATALIDQAKDALPKAVANPVRALLCELADAIVVD